MLRINVYSKGPSHLTFQSFETLGLPKPPNGIDSEINNDVILLFENEEEAVNYADQLKDVVADMDDSSQQKLAINDIIEAISTNQFIRSYLE